MWYTDWMNSRICVDLSLLDFREHSGEEGKGGGKGNCHLPCKVFLPFFFNGPREAPSSSDVSWSLDGISAE